MTKPTPYQTSCQAKLLDDGKRLHLQHGPIDLVIEAFGEPAQITQSYQQAITRFQTILQELVDELPLLRSQTRINSEKPQGKVAQEMYTVVAGLTSGFITPMAAVAGAVADEILATMVEQTSLDKAYVNNGGDIAVYLNPSSMAEFNIAIVANPVTGKIVSHATITATDKIAGIATSGWHGRSHSLGIADAVTVFAATASKADVVATIIANNVDLPGNPKIIRQPASELSPESDLGDLPVTIAVGNLTGAEVNQALNNGEKVARQLLQEGKILAAFLNLQDHFKIIGWPDHNIDAKPVYKTSKRKQERIAYA